MATAATELPLLASPEVIMRSGSIKIITLMIIKQAQYDGRGMYPTYDRSDARTKL
jgi:hypothetical protein